MALETLKIEHFLTKMAQKIVQKNESRARFISFVLTDNETIFQLNVSSVSNKYNDFIFPMSKKNKHFT